jgi:PAS domain S-box-containing protein
MEYLNPAFERVAGRPATDILANFDLAWEVVHPEDRPIARGSFPRALAGEPYEAEYRILRPDGKVRWINDAAFPVFGPDDVVRRVAGLARDITERRHAEERQKFLLAELNHRVKNTLATVQSLVVQSIRRAHDLSAFRESFESRIIALAKTHDILTRGHWEGAHLEDILSGEFAPYQSEKGRVTLKGPEIHLRPSQALSLGLVIHELATNAAKYGALSSVNGTLNISWQTEQRKDGPWLHLEWREEGGPPVKEPESRGFGMLLLHRSASEELMGAAQVTFAPGGLTCLISFPFMP